MERHIKPDQKTLRLRALARQLAELQEIERQRLSRELHDRIGQNLTALGINLNIIHAQMPEGLLPKIQQRLEDSLLLIEQTSEQVRDVMVELRPPLLDDYGLVPAMRWYGEEFARRTGIAVTVAAEEPDSRCTSRIENALFRIAQEALTNVARHAQAEHVSMSIVRDSESMRLIIADDGVGCNAAALSEPAIGTGWGLLIMQERAEMINGRCHIESAPDHGVRVIIDIDR